MCSSDLEENSFPPLPGAIVSSAQFRACTGLDSGPPSPHEFLCTGSRTYLILEKARRLFPETLRWQGFGVGKAAEASLSVDPALRLFVPPEPDGGALVLDEVPPIHALLSGQSMPSGGTGGRRVDGVVLERVLSASIAATSASWVPAG